jgi:hypothetical protein
MATKRTTYRNIYDDGSEGGALFETMADADRGAAFGGSTMNKERTHVRVLTLHESGDISFQLIDVRPKKAEVVEGAVVAKTLFLNRYENGSLGQRYDTREKADQGASNTFTALGTQTRTHVIVLTEDEGGNLTAEVIDVRPPKIKDRFILVTPGGGQVGFGTEEGAKNFGRSTLAVGQYRLFRLPGESAIEVVE